MYTEVITIFDLEYIKEIFINNDLTPMFDEYKNSRTKLKAINSDGYLVYTNLDNLRSERAPKPFHKSNPYTLDNIKNKYCEDNGISLFRIPYYEIKKIEEMLDDIMSTI